MVASSVHGCSRASAAATETVTPASVFANASRIVVFAASSASRSAVSVSWLDRDHRGGVSRNRVAALAPVQRDEAERRLRVRLTQRTPEDLDRIRAAERDARSRVPALTAGNGDGQRHGVGRGSVARSVDSHPCVRAARAADREPAVLLAVEVDEDRARDQLGVERICAFEPDLLGHRHQQLERAVRQRPVLDQRHHRRDRDAIVCAERGPVSLQPFAVADEHDAPLGRVVRAGGVPLAHHVEVPLEGHGRRRLASRSRRHADDQVSPLVLLKIEAVQVRPGANVLDDRLLCARRSRDPRQRSEVIPERAGLEIVEYRYRSRHHRSR